MKIKEQKYTYVIGLMSGTSLDGVDLVYVRFGELNESKILKAITVPYTSYWFDQLKNVALHSKGSKELERLDVDLGKYYAQLINDFILENQLGQIDLIASHGHTVHHQPEIVYTLQIGCGKEIFKHTQVKTIYDFRIQDVLLGGQGAPLVPIGDAMLFPEYDYCLNLGGFSNVSYDENGVRKAFDVCPVNTVLNFYAAQLGFDYDDQGDLARTGKVNLELLEVLNDLNFYKSTIPKSLGVEFLTNQVFPILSAKQISTIDLLRTFVEHIACQIGEKLKQGVVLVTGGGAYNIFLLERIKSNNSLLNLVLPSKELIDYKEALIFALLGKLRLEEKVNCLSSVTGASKDHSSGKICGNF